MDLPLYLKAIVLGILEGATEFLPISSTGHLIIANDLLSFTGERAKTFDIFIQLGAICAIVWHYRKRIYRVIGSLFSDPAALRFTINVLIGFLPAAVLGLLLHKTIKAQLFNPITVAGALIVGGLAILAIESRRRAHRVEDIDDLTWHVALKVGFAQSLALFPGVSRAGATIMGGLLSGMSRSAATEFSFFLAIPTMFAATSYDLYKNLNIMRPEDIQILAIGFIAAFFSAWLVVRALLAFVSRHSFKAFAWYRILFGSLALIYFLSTSGLTVSL
ncbi:undecaprenyl-diphosphate phosphatase [Methylocaldum szegediense]|uniref:Undecaprenyl-diphosphatase n=1 Tax=Methylocaldum szegediense TaxID=73780 RepID=A0ABN8XC21_9GAMM|nr:undecaprenyl-diphosphate phosphatase [Methylocaldum szegediense]CAI8954272.1 Undecaprenyl-diphosphatase [Methylocaldum szegediense]